MDLKKKVAELERDLKKTQEQMYRLQGAIILAKELLEEAEPEPKDE